MFVNVLAAIVILLGLSSPDAVGAPTRIVAKLLASDGVAGDLFGSSVAISEDTLVVGAFRDDNNGIDSGSAYIFERNAGGSDNWGQVAKLTASDGAFDDLFGVHVAISGDTVVVSAHKNDDNGTDSGSAYIFERNAGGSDNWGQVAKLTVNDGATFDHFGFSVAIFGDTVVVGALRDDDNGTDSGSAYVFERNAGGADNWGQVAKLTASDGVAEDFFGTSVGISGDTVMVGATSVYVFERDAGGADNWGQVGKLTASGGAAGDFFGFSLAISADTLVVGAYRDDDNGTESGSAYIFERDAGGPDNWGQVAKLTASDGAAEDRFGISVAISGNTVMVGAFADDDNGVDSGSVYVFGPPDDEGPITSMVEAILNPVAVNMEIDLTAVVDDTNTGGSVIHSAEYSIDGGSFVDMVATDGFDAVIEDVVGTIASFMETGVHEICVRGTDVAGNVGPEECTLLVVYDPYGGFVIGAGWINSPEGACQLSWCTPDTTGKANFGFVSKYKKGASTPSGETEFQFNAGDLNFHSSSYDWLVVAGAKAMYKGMGTINGEGNYGFLLKTIDEKLTPSTDVDLFRIKIWDENDGDTVVYDNQTGAGNDTDPIAAIGGGSIVIHAK